MKKLTYSIAINAPVEKVFTTMLSPETYKQWTYEFNPTSYYEGGWNKGDKILFIGIDDQGKKGGMVACIEENIPNRFVSIRHYGLLDGDNEITEGPAVEGWANAMENYSFSEADGITTVTADVDVNADYIAYFDEKWPKALDKLKNICES